MATREDGAAWAARRCAAGIGVAWALAAAAPGLPPGLTHLGSIYAEAIVSPDAPEPTRPSSPPAAELPAASVWLVDGYNVLHAGLLHREDRGQFWSPAHRERLRRRVECFTAAAESVWLVFDGARASEETTRGDHGTPVHTLFAPSADDWLVARVRAAPEPERLAVVTGDRRVAGRARHRGAHVVSPRTFLDHCDV